MSKKIKTIFEYFSEYSKKEIDEVINKLNENDKELLSLRYGEDVKNPFTNIEWNEKTRKRFYDTLIPKIRRRLEENRNVRKKIIVLERFLRKTVGIEFLDEEERLLELIRERKNNNEICEILKIEQYQLYNMLLSLKNKGKAIQRKYYSDGTIKYKSITTLGETKIGQDRTLITDINNDSLKLLAISDLHVGNDLERMDLINRAFNYCAKNGIHVILSGGDLIDGKYTQGTQRISDVRKQLEYFIKNYPYDKNILTFGVAGDHDFSAFCQSSLDIIEVLNNYRHDIVIGGYNNSGINIKNDSIHLYHHIQGASLRHTKSPIILHGHAHKFSTETVNNRINITLPTLSDINQLMPSAVELNLSFKNGFIVYLVIKQIYFGSQDIVLSELSFDNLKSRGNQCDRINNVEHLCESPSVESRVLKK